MVASVLSTDLKMALDPVVFGRERLEFEPDPWQERALRWTGRRLMLNCSRQTGKSTIASILGLHRALYYPRSLVLLISPSLRQSSELFRKVTERLEGLDGKKKRPEDNKLSCQLANGSRIVSLPSNEATIRGFSGASLIIEDEASRVMDALYLAIRPMLAVSGGRLILMSTPFGRRGHFFEEWTEGGASWERVEITAEQCPRITPEFLAEERKTMPDMWYRQEYFCEFLDTIDQVFGYETVMSSVSDEVKPLFGSVENGAD